MYMQLVKGLNPEHLAVEFNKVAQKFVNPEVRWINDTTLFIYGEEEVPTWEQETEEDKPHWADRQCCECGHYAWGRGFCTYCDHGIRHETEACEHFDVNGEAPESRKH